jgi:hypothetical protein
MRERTCSRLVAALFRDAVPVLVPGFLEKVIGS